MTVCQPSSGIASPHEKYYPDVSDPVTDNPDSLRQFNNPRANQLTNSTHATTQLPIVLAITGASGAIYAARTLQWLLAEGRRVHLVVSPDGITVIRQELNYSGGMLAHQIHGFFKAANDFLSQSSRKASTKPPTAPDRSSSGSLDASPAPDASTALDAAVGRSLNDGLLQVHRSDDYFVSIASGSYRTSAMVVCPCSGTTMAAIAHASGRNLIHRAAEVHLKERRKLILVPRETPLSLMQIENMLRVTQAGAVVLPAAPGWYHGVHDLGDLVDFVAARILDQLDISHERVRRWS